MNRELVVWFFGEAAGVLSQQRGKLSFQYLPAWLARKDSAPLSVSLPLREEPYSDDAARPFFSGLLPEGRLRQLIAQQLQVSHANDMAMLDGIGGECAGAVTFLPAGATLPNGGDSEPRWLTDEELARLIEELPRRPMLVGKEGMRLSLAGAQNKLPVTFDGERVGLPQAGTPSTHILKPAIAGVEDSVLNEAFCLALASALNLTAATAQVHSAGEQPVLLVSRYDRQTKGANGLERLHQEDFCQALGVPPELKYQAEGGPDLAQCFALLRQCTRPSAPHILRLLDYVIFNALVGNHDAHAKNFSLLYREGKATLAPLYDVLSTAAYPDLTPNMAMKLGGKYKFADVFPRHWERFAEASGLGKAQMRKRVLELARALPETARRLAEEAPYRGSPTIANVVRLIGAHASMTERRFGEAATGG